MQTKAMHRTGAFSLVELVIVVVIIAVIGAIAIPRMSQGAKGASDAALKADLAALSNAIEMYAAEHNGTYPTLAAFEAQLTQYSDTSGSTSATKTGDFVYGPYLREIPPLKVGPEKGQTAATDTAGTADKGWVYNQSTGDIRANTTTETDSSGKLYSAY